MYTSPPTYNGVRVEYISGKKDSYFIGSSRTATFEGPNLKRVYFPWSAHSLDYKSITGEVYHRFPKDATVVFTACYDIIDASKIVVPLASYKQYEKTGLFGWKHYSGEAIPANISYLFNYPDAPNRNYFLVDLVESTGRLRRPPYEPERNGYVFGGWYKDAECTELWDFNKDVVEISYDGNGARIYEELWLYAKWETKNWWEFWK